MDKENMFPEEEQEDYGKNIISVIDENNVEHLFEELDRTEYDGEEYVALLAVYDDAEDILDSEYEPYELIILKSTMDGEEFYLEPVEDEELFDKLGELFEERLQDMYDFDDED